MEQSSFQCKVGRKDIKSKETGKGGRFYCGASTARGSGGAGRNAHTVGTGGGPVRQARRTQAARQAPLPDAGRQLALVIPEVGA